MTPERTAKDVQRLSEALQKGIEEQRTQIELAREANALLAEFNEGLRKLLVTVGARPPEPPPGPRRIP